MSTAAAITIRPAEPDIADEIVACLQLVIIPGVSRLGALRGQIEGVRVASSHRGQRIGEALDRDG